ncbi:peptidylprolyl isomerase [Lachnoanaerobaculum umeaense]|uniref:Peptidylprolyl isomerase n=2 Tax=Lachnoanaerobaculum umeaense TaxID=617123 RepID=A0A385Q1E2_9FIRM|nr:peptidylprolyl isomerase [Lachnoanaerobaculum umeaense]
MVIMDRPMTNEEQIIEIDKAISSILRTGQSYKIGSRALTRADLGTLRAMRKDLLAASEDNGTDLFSNTFVAVFDRR